MAILKSSEFIFTPSQEAAGIDGRLMIKLKVDKKGIVTDADILAGPIWPCDKKPEKELKEFKLAAIKNVRTFEFAPKLEDGKAVKTEIILTLTVGSIYNIEKRPIKGISRFDAGVINGRATKLAMPQRPLSIIKAALVYVDVIIDTEGKVVAAGAISGPPEYQDVSRIAACRSEFSKTTIDGKPVLVTGRITYNFIPTRTW